MNMCRKLIHGLSSYFAGLPGAPATIDGQHLPSDIGRQVAGQIGDGSAEIVFVGHPPQRGTCTVPLFEAPGLTARHTAGGDYVDAHIRCQRRG